MAGSHGSTVRALYKQILLLHRRLPLEMKALGDQYVKAEFRRHKEAKPEEVTRFMREWQMYATTLAQQTQGVTADGEAQQVGEHMAEAKLEDLNDTQVGQLYELYKETKKPSQFLHQEET
ncbi:succinate dehydrogenase assembly factor 3, mitochondrial-like [Diadema antillarum]|uniref:succinate dehydrogenase assembly factor 3, mitochondrial-like n=1 Tax=Diadema antillarum TaxID=105358 RepID=UPI003A8C671C